MTTLTSLRIASMLWGVTGIILLLANKPDAMAAFTICAMCYVGVAICEKLDR